MRPDQVRVKLYLKDPSSSDGYGVLIFEGDAEHIEWYVDGEDPAPRSIQDSDIYQVALEVVDPTTGKNQVVDTWDRD